MAMFYVSIRLIKGSGTTFGTVRYSSAFVVQFKTDYLSNSLASHLPLLQEGVAPTEGVLVGVELATVPEHKQTNIDCDLSVCHSPFLSYVSTKPEYQIQ
jgi:hypothetical protein